MIVSVTGGKGGTGKSFVATNLAYYLSKNLPDKRLVLADLDVEAPNDHILLGVKRLEAEEDVDIFFPKIDYSKCTSCGACVKACDTGAIIMAGGRPPFVFPRLCSGCWACYYVCPYKAISSGGRRTLAKSYATPVELDGARFTLVTGILREGEEHTPPAIIRVKRRALGLEPDILLVDTGAGTGSGITVAIHYSVLIIAVTEPTPMGAHDLDAILQVADGLETPAWVVINRSGIGPEEILGEVIARHKSVERVYRIPYSRTVIESYVRGDPILHYKPSDPGATALRRVAGDLLEVVKSMLRRG
ncbi:MAG: 4Fe-4S binding protein [Desulfurococcales archaeon]|nr:4Fe-4S binding protein [Desulfurococcales archaeon]